MAEFNAYEGLSNEEIRVVQNLSKWQSGRVASFHQSLLGLVDKVRMRLESYVDRIQPSDNWIPPMEWTAAFRTVVDGGAKLITEFYRREAKNPAMGLTDEQLEIELQKAAVALLDTVPLDDVERVLRRRRYVEAHGEERQPPGQRKVQNVGRLPEGGK